jgi:hypothetical protein
MADDDARQRVHALGAHQIILRRVQPENITARFVRKEFAPLRASPCGLLRRHDLEVDSAVGVGDDVPAAIPVRRRVEHVGSRTLKRMGCAVGLAAGMV